MVDLCQGDQQSVIAFLERSESYGLTEPVVRIDTHAAVIFLAGERAYKLKRAVRYPYFDFSSAAKRKRVCKTELALNRRTAPDLYLEVRSVNRLSNGALGFGEGEPVDWLVVMRRFEPDALLETVASRGALDAPLVRDLADEIARFHDSAETSRCEDGARRLRGVIDGNRESMTALPPALLPARDCDELYVRSTAEWARRAELLDRRAAEGHVRHCHGDLHLANICLWRGRPTLFDCLEFDTQLATIDVLYDLAFLLMDLWERDHHAQAALLFNRYLDMRDEGDGIAAIPLFLSMRASVRAHVSANAASHQTSEQKRLTKLARAREYLRVAGSFLERNAPRLVAVGGLSGTGKSTLAARLAPGIGGAPGARWLRTDVLRKRLAGVVPEVRLSREAYTRERSAATYRKLLEDAGSILVAGHSVIVDGVFADPDERKRIAEVAKSLGVPFTGLWLTAPRETLIARVAARHGDASDADQAVVERQLEYDLGDMDGWLLIDARGSPDDVLTTAHIALSPCI